MHSVNSTKNTSELNEHRPGILHNICNVMFEPARIVTLKIVLMWTHFRAEAHSQPHSPLHCEAFILCGNARHMRKCMCCRRPADFYLFHTFDDHQLCKMWGCLILSNGRSDYLIRDRSNTLHPTRIYVVNGNSGWSQQHIHAYSPPITAEHYVCCCCCATLHHTCSSTSKIGQMWPQLWINIL